MNDRGVYLSSLFAFDFNNNMWHHVRVKGWDVLPARLAFHCAHVFENDCPAQPNGAVADEGAESPVPPPLRSGRRVLYIFGGEMMSAEGMVTSDTLLRVVVNGKRGGLWGEVKCSQVCREVLRLRIPRTCSASAARCLSHGPAALCRCSPPSLAAPSPAAPSLAARRSSAPLTAPNSPERHSTLPLLLVSGRSTGF